MWVCLSRKEKGEKEREEGFSLFYIEKRVKVKTKSRHAWKNLNINLVQIKK